VAGVGTCATGVVLAAAGVDAGIPVEVVGACTTGALVAGIG
jgi:hypothetical protein